MLVTNYKAKMVQQFHKIDNMRKELALNKQYFYDKAPKSHLQLGCEVREVIN